MRLSPWIATVVVTMVGAALSEFAVSAPPLTVRCVHPDGDDNNDGETWSTPWETLTHALAAHHATPSAFTQIWLAKGGSGFAYTPDEYSESASFVVQDSVAIYGGFAGNEDSEESRIEGARTVLSGDLGKYGRSYHIVKIPAGISNGLIVFDGIRFEQSGHSDLSGFLDSAPGGGAIAAQSVLTANWGTLRLRNCVFFGNVAWLNGGAIWSKQWNLNAKDCTFNANRVIAGDGSQFVPQVNYEWPCAGGAIKHEGAPLLLSRCVFTSNECDNYSGGSAYEFGGAVYAVIEGGSSSNGFLSNCEFRYNFAAGGPEGRGVGGALWLNRGESFAVPADVINCVFTDNSAGEQGGGVYCTTGCKINATTICGNVAGQEGGGVALGGSAVYDVENSILWGNEAASSGGYGQQIHLIGANITLHLSHNCVTEGPTTDGHIASDPQFVDEGASPRDLRLVRPSPAVDSASNALRTADSTDVNDANGTSEAHPLDLDLTARLKGCVLDMGAYESAESECPSDFNDDGEVNGADLGGLLANWGECEGCLGDFDCDEDVDGADLGVLLAAWGPCTEPTMMSPTGESESALGPLMAYLSVESVEELVAALSGMNIEDMLDILEWILLN